jgi:hypothetical protein
MTILITRRLSVVGVLTSSSKAAARQRAAIGPTAVAPRASEVKRQVRCVWQGKLAGRQKTSRPPAPVAYAPRLRSRKPASRLRISGTRCGGGRPLFLELLGKPGDVLGAHPDLDRRALEVLPDWLETTAQVRCQERFRYRVKSEAVFRADKPVAFV